ncbi:DUF4432 family protein [Rhizobium sp. G21]|uniref:DUF4432 family protein n=1 Tax=Rhizobium sp. G21 TaxID=2758439 RepID=UPI001603F535|nr:DUF4432 family protein [Rhizobium sp. G21]MBB1250613.1 DUF4432 family protein [Rhizobium sp. G21]
MRLGDARFELELDEQSALDVLSALAGGVDLAPGGAVPDDGDPRIFRAVHGFLFTCGPDHIRHPEPVAAMDGTLFPLHGSLSGNGAVITGRRVDEAGQSVEARIKVTLADGGVAEIQRLWHFDAASGAFTLEDTVQNIGASPFPPMMMYHMNVGARLFDDATGFSGASFPDGRIGWRFGDGEGAVVCSPAEADDDGKAHVSLGPIGGAGGGRLDVWFDADAMPHLQMWRNEAGHCSVIGIEPASHPLEKRVQLEAGGLMPVLHPGDARHFRLGFRFV